jgi:flagellar FliL protein
MSDAAAETTELPAGAPRPGRRRLLFGSAAAALAATGGFYAAWSGLLPIPGGDGAATMAGDAAQSAPAPLGDIAFVPIDPVVINLGTGGTNRHLRFRAQLEVNGPYRAEVEAMLPRVLDVLNGYLRAVGVSDLEEPTALVTLRAQMLRRVQLVTGEGRVRDLLIMEFVLN